MTRHYLKRPSSFTVVVFRSLNHLACVACGYPIRNLEESYAHWETELKAGGELCQDAGESIPDSGRIATFIRPHCGAVRSATFKQAESGKPIFCLHCHKNTHLPGWKPSSKGGQK